MMRSTLRRSGCRLGAAALLVLAGTAVLGALAPAAFATVNQVPTRTWQTNGRVLTAVAVGDRVYIGGRFTQLRPPSGSSGSSVTRNHIAAINLRTGKVLRWNPNANADVYTIAPLSHGKRLAVGGDFTNIGGLHRRRAAMLSASTGRASSAWNFKANGRVRTIDVSATRVFLGGKFTAAGGTTRHRLASFSRTSGRVTGWSPNANAVVRTIAVDGNAVFLGGQFTAIDSHHSQDHFAVLNGRTGDIRSFGFHPAGYTVQHIRVTGTSVYVAGAGNGGNLVAVDRPSGHQRWRRVSDGDFQGVAIVSHVLYAGGHFSNICLHKRHHGNPLVCDQPLPRNKLIALSPDTGRISNWHASANSRSGVFVTTSSNEGLVIGGDFSKVTNVAQEGIALLHR